MDEKREHARSCIRGDEVMTARGEHGVLESGGPGDEKRGYCGKYDTLRAGAFDERSLRFASSSR